MTRNSWLLCTTRSAHRLDLRVRSNSVCRALTVVSITLRNSNAFIVCLLDDDPSVLKGLGRLLLSADLRAETFSDPDEFLRHARTHRPAVALVDVHMPQMNGLEVQSRLREISPSTRVIIFSGKDDPLVRSTALNAGASALLARPKVEGARSRRIKKNAPEIKSGWDYRASKAIRPHGDASGAEAETSKVSSPERFAINNNATTHLNAGIILS